MRCSSQRQPYTVVFFSAFPSFSVALSSHQLVVADKVRAAVAAPAPPLAVPVEAGGAERQLADLLADERLLLILLLHALMLRFGRKPDSFSLRSCQSLRFLRASARFFLEPQQLCAPLLFRSLSTRR